MAFVQTQKASLQAKYEAQQAEKKAAEQALKAKKTADQNARHKLLRGEKPEEEDDVVYFDF